MPRLSYSHHDTTTPTPKLTRLASLRYDTAWSYNTTYSKGDVHVGPCSPAPLDCKLCPCPLTMDVALPVAPEKWARLSYFQQYLWMVDEAEAQWQSTLGRSADEDVLEVEWASRTSIGADAFRRVAAFIHPDLVVDAGELTVKKKSHVADGKQGDASDHAAALAGEDADYRRIVAAK